MGRWIWEEFKWQQIQGKLLVIPHILHDLLDYNLDTTSSKQLHPSAGTNMNVAYSQKAAVKALGL